MLFEIYTQICMIGRLAWSDIMEIFLYDLWLLTLWRVISVTNGCIVAFLYLNDYKIRLFCLKLIYNNVFLVK